MTHSQEKSAAPHRPVDGPLMLGIILTPYLFVWFLGREGHSNKARVWGLVYLAAFVLVLWVGPIVYSSWIVTKPAQELIQR